MADLDIGEMCSLPEASLFSLFLNFTKDDDDDDGPRTTFSSLAAASSGAGAAAEDDANATFGAFLSNARALCSHHDFETVVSRLVPVVFAAIVVLGVVGNALVLVVVLCGKQMRNTTNVLILVRRFFDLF